MKKVSKFFTLFLLIVSVIFSYCIPALAVLQGDVDNDGKISAFDARTVLRASVGLESLSDEELANADIDKDGKITANDARMILRASVGLGLHIHEYINRYTKSATCTENGEKQLICECGKIKTLEIPQLQHNFEDGFCTVCHKESQGMSVLLPRLDFTGDISGMSNKKDVREIGVTYSSKNISFAGAAKLKVQGTSSLTYNKKNYTINFYEDDSFNSKMDVNIGWGNQSIYCLKANWIDKTHARNIVTANIAAEIQQKYGIFTNTPHNGTIDGFPIEIYINGEFLGIYTFNIPKDAWLFNMDESNPNHIIFCNEGYAPANLFNAPADYDTWSLEIGEETDEKLEKLNTLISFIKDSTDEEFRNEFKNHLNLDSTLNYYIITEFAHLRDNHAKNMLLVTYDGQIWYPSLYDLDTSWGAYWDGSSLFDYENESVAYHTNVLWNRFTKLFASEIKDRYHELREEFLTKEFVLNKFNTFKNLIPDDVFAAESEKWGKIPGFDIEQISLFLDYIVPAMDLKYGYDNSSNPLPEEPSSENTSTEAPSTEEISTEELSTELTPIEE